MFNYLKIELGLKSLFREDGYLLEKGIAERAITHKLGEHLQYIFPEWNVDCEYNKNIDQYKGIGKEDVRMVLVKMENYLRENFSDGIQFGENDIYTKEEIQNLRNQLLEADRIHYIKSIDLYLFSLSINGKRFRQTVYPDIIIHHRGTKNNNIVIEAKKTGSKKIERLYDLVKLAVFILSSEYKYKKGFFIELPVKENFHRFSNFKTEELSIVPNLYEITPQY
jgi:hypothetical protein